MTDSSSLSIPEDLEALIVEVEEIAIGRKSANQLVYLRDNMLTHNDILTPKASLPIGAMVDEIVENIPALNRLNALEKYIGQLSSTSSVVTDIQIRFFTALLIVAVRDFDYLGDALTKDDPDSGKTSSGHSKQEDVIAKVVAKREELDKEFTEDGDHTKWSRGLSELAGGLHAGRVIDELINSLSRGRGSTDRDKGSDLTDEEKKSRAEVIYNFLNRFSGKIENEDMKTIADKLTSELGIYLELDFDRDLALEVSDGSTSDGVRPTNQPPQAGSGPTDPLGR